MRHSYDGQPNGGVYDRVDVISPAAGIDTLELLPPSDELAHSHVTHSKSVHHR